MSVAMRWSSETLQAGYARCVVGFDARQPRTEQSPASLSPVAWQRAELDQADDGSFANGFNLFIAVEPLLALHGGIQVVAFDLPMSLTDVVLSTFGLCPLPLPSLNEWSFLGFDIVDPRTQSSAIYDFSMAAAHEIRMNENGLIEDEVSAIKAAVLAESMIPEHAPFCPCGVWVKKTNRVGATLPKTQDQQKHRTVCF